MAGRERFGFLGEIENSAATIERVIKRLALRYDQLHVCFEAGPTGYELYRHGIWAMTASWSPRR